MATSGDGNRCVTDVVVIAHYILVSLTFDFSFHPNGEALQLWSMIVSIIALYCTLTNNDDVSDCLGVTVAKLAGDLATTVFVLINPCQQTVPKISASVLASQTASETTASKGAKGKPCRISQQTLCYVRYW